MIKPYIYLLLLTCVCNLPVLAQSDIKLSLQSFQPMFNNPAYAGSYDGLSVSALYSTQWTGFEGAPNTQFLTANYRFVNNKVGAGLTVFKDEIGPVREFNVETNYAYHIDLNDDLRLAMGLKAGLNNFHLDYNKLNIQDPGELDNFQGQLSQLSPLVGAGFYLYTDNLFVGASSPNLIPMKYYDDTNRSVGEKDIYMYSTAGYQFWVNYDLNITPMLQYRYAVGAPSSLVVMSNLEWKDQLFFGLNVDFEASMGAFVAVRFLEQFKAAYAYDSSLNNFGEQNRGGHTFQISYELQNNRFHERRPYNRL